MSNHKERILERISSNAQKFDSEYINQFICPTCLNMSPVSSVSNISEAHIIPKYVGGRLKTYLCKKCNSDFGKHQDHWFGEYLYIYGTGKSLFSTKKQSGGFSINGVKARGDYEELDDGNIEIKVYENRMSPQNRIELQEAQKNAGLELTCEFPIYDKENLIKVGFITAAYLLWFKELGYSWVFQSHLNLVREQILKPNEVILPDKSVLDMGEVHFDKPWIGFLEIGKHSYPCAGITDRIVLFPAINAPNPYELLKSVKTLDVNYEAVRISDRHEFPDPIGIVYRDEVMVFPDKFQNGMLTPKIFKYAGDGQPPQVLYSVEN